MKALKRNDLVWQLAKLIEIFDQVGIGLVINFKGPLNNLKTGGCPQIFLAALADSSSTVLV